MFKVNLPLAITYTYINWIVYDYVMRIAYGIHHEYKNYIFFLNLFTLNVVWFKMFNTEQFVIGVYVISLVDEQYS